jgi:hypothetical protein
MGGAPPAAAAGCKAPPGRLKFHRFGFILRFGDVTPAHAAPVDRNAQS